MSTKLSMTLRTHPLAAYFALAYSITWSLELPLVASAQGWIGGPVPFSLHYVAQFGPMVAAMIVTATLGGRAGLRALRDRLTRWRLGLGWWLVAISPLLLFLAATASAQGGV